MRHAIYDSIPKLFDSDSAFSLSFHLKYAPQKEKHTIVSQAQQHNAQGMEVYIKDHKLGFSYIRHHDREHLFVDAVKELEHNKWQHITVTYDGSQKAAGVKMYLNGTLLPQKVIHDNFPTKFINTQTFMIGRRDVGRNTNNPISLLQIYDRVLQGNEISAVTKLTYDDLALTRMQTRILR